jgi:hypothetical protein
VRRRFFNLPPLSLKKSAKSRANSNQKGDPSHREREGKTDQKLPPCAIFATIRADMTLLNSNNEIVSIRQWHSSNQAVRAGDCT